MQRIGNLIERFVMKKITDITGQLIEQTLARFAAGSIGGGADEIMLGIIAKTMGILPRS